MMARPDLNTSEGVDTYRGELRSVGKPVRMAAYGLILAGFAGVMGSFVLDAWPQWLINAGYIALGLGWILMVTAVFMRTRYYRRRMAETE